MRVNDVPRLDDVHDAFGRWLEFPDLNSRSFEHLDVALAVVVANRMDGDPLWVFLVAPPSGGKTEVIRSLNDVPDVFPLSSLTPQTFASGFERKGHEASLLPRLTGKIITMKDFTTVLTMYRETRAEILAQLREIYDGSYAKAWGNGREFRWEGKVGLLAGVTPAIDREYAMHQIMGERFLLYRVKSAPSRSLALRAIGQSAASETDQRAVLRTIVAQFLEHLLPVPPPMPAEITEAIAALAEFTAIARSPIIFDQRGEIEYIPATEAPARLAQQLALLARALAVVRGEREVDLSTYVTVSQVAQDTLPAQRQVMLEVLLDPERHEPATTTEIAKATRYPTVTARRYLQELAALRLVDRIAAEGPGHPDRWCASGLLTGLLNDMNRPLTQLGVSVV